MGPSLGVPGQLVTLDLPATAVFSGEPFGLAGAVGELVFGGVPLECLAVVVGLLAVAVAA